MGITLRRGSRFLLQSLKKANDVFYSRLFYMMTLFLLVCCRLLMIEKKNENRLFTLCGHYSLLCGCHTLFWYIKKESTTKRTSLIFYRI